MRSVAEQADGNFVGMWRQLTDLLAQNPRDTDPEMVALGLIQVHQLSSRLDDVERVEGVRALARRIQSPPLVQLLSRDIPAVASAAISGAILSDAEWSELVPEMTVRARGFLRARPDLGPLTQRALASWAGADFRLSGHVAAPESPEEQSGQPAAAAPSKIGAIVQRIEEWRRNRDAGEAPRLPLGDDTFVDFAAPILEIRFETDDNGAIVWVEGAPRGAIVGTDIATAAYDNGPGPDAYGAAAFHQRMPMENARMALRGSPLVEGDWRVTAAPFFDPDSGRFRGFRGLLRRPNIAEKPEIEGESPEQRKRHGESMQQIVHELRTPLGAIAGFAEIIEQQLFGPVAGDYREMASAILDDAKRLLAGFEDISTAARLDAGNLPIETGVTECDWLVKRVAERLASISDTIGVEVNLSVAGPVRPFAVERDMAERIFSRLLSAIIIGGGRGEVLHGRFKTEPGRIVRNKFTVDLPSKLRSFSEEELLGSGTLIEEDIADGGVSPLLGLGFSLRLVRNLAHKLGGDLRFQKESLVLAIPAVQDGDMDFRDTGGD